MITKKWFTFQIKYQYEKMPIKFEFTKIVYISWYHEKNKKNKDYFGHFVEKFGGGHKITFTFGH